MSKWDTNIEGDHLRVASHKGSTMRVLAGPGTGKSFALQRKVMRLLEESNDPTRILAVTFTNVAADALKKDLSDLDAPGAELVRARTLHSLCFEILRKQQVLELTGRVPRPLMEFETNFLLEDLKDEFGGKKATKELLQAYESAFARQQQDDPGVIQSPIDLRFKNRLLEWLDFHQAMLIGELIPITYEYLKNNPTAPEFDLYDFILVDEYQDLNKAEQALIDLLAQKAELLVVGDDDQSIYSFKHAHPAGITEFHSTHQPLEDVNLKLCRRCPKKVVALANELMGYLLETDHPKKLAEFPTNPDGQIYATQWVSAEAETEGIGKLIKAMVSDPNSAVAPEDILVLAPRRQLGYALRDTLQNSYGIGCHTFFQEEALDTAKSQVAYATFNYLINPNDRVALRVLLGSPTPLPATYKKLCDLAKEENVSPRELLVMLQEGEIIMSRSEQLLPRFEAADNFTSAIKGKPLKDIIDALFDPSIPEGIEVLLSLISTLSITDETDAQTFFGRLQDRIRSPEVTDESGYLRIMSLHKSKGLTSKAVFILGCVAGLVPTIKDEQELRRTNQIDELQRLQAEAKRLFFVALTRTKQYLVLSSFREVDFRTAKQLNIKIHSRPGSSKAYTQTSPFFGEVTKHLPRVVPGEEILRQFNVA